MKKILFIIALFGGFIANSQTPAGYTTINSRYDWLAGLFKALGLPSGGTAAFTTGQAQRAGSVYYDSTGSNAGFYIYDGAAWVLQGTPTAVDLPNALLSGGSVTPQGTGFNLSVAEAVYRINGIIYGSDSATLTLSGSDPSLNRIDYIYLGTDGLPHVLEGTPGLPAAEPRLENDQLGIAFVSIPAGSTTPGISTVVIYNENTESTVSNVGTTTDPDNTAPGTVFTGAKSVNVTNINANDLIYFTAPVTFNASGFDGLAIHMLPKAVLSSGNRLFLRIEVGSTAVSNEVEIVWNRSSITTFQAITISAAALGTLTNYSPTRIRIRYVGSSTVFPGFYFDYIFFQTGTSQPAPGGGGFPNITPPSGWTTTGNGTQNITLVAPGDPAKTMRGDGSQRIDSAVKVVDPIDTYAKNNNGATINPATNSIGFHLVNTTYNGLMSALQARQLDTLLAQTIENATTGDTLIYAIDEFRTAVKVPVAGTNMALVSTDSTIVFNATGGGSGGKFGVSGEDDTQAELRDFTTNGDLFRIKGTSGIYFQQETPGSDSVYLSLNNQHIVLSSRDAVAGINWGIADISIDEILFDHWEGDYKFTNVPDTVAGTNFAVVWNSVTNKIHRTPLSGLGGGGGGGGSTETASEGLTKVSNDIQFGGPIGSPSTFTVNRVLDLNSKQLYFAKHYTPVSDDTVNASFQVKIIDSVNSNNPGGDAVRVSGTDFNRTLRYTGNYQAQFRLGHVNTLNYEFGDTARIISNGGDFGGTVYNTLRLGYLPSKTTGRASIAGGVSDFEGTFAAISNVELPYSNASRHLKIHGWISAHHAYLRMINQPDSIDNFIFYNALAFKEAAAKVGKSYSFYANVTSAVGDSSFSFYSPSDLLRSYHAGNVSIGGGYSGSAYKLRVHGTGYYDDDLTLNSLAGNGSGVVAVDNNGLLSWSAAGAPTFVGLTDGPGSFTGNGGKMVAVNVGETDLEYVAGLSNPMTTLNDMIAGGSGGTPIRVAAGTAGQFLRIKGDLSGLEYATIAGGGDALVSSPLSQFAATTSDQLAGVLTNETGSAGGFVRATSPTITTPTISGTVTTSAISLTTTTPSGEGNSLSEMTARVNSDVTLANSAADQTLFGTTNDVWTLQGNTTYKFKGVYRLTSGTTAHTWAMGFTLGGGASITSMLYSAGSWVQAVNTGTTARTNVYIDQVASTVVTASSTTAAFIEFEGIIVMNAGGTVTPIIKASVDPTGTILLKANSYITFTPVGDGSFEKIGNVN